MYIPLFSELFNRIPQGREKSQRQCIPKEKFHTSSLPAARAWLLDGEKFGK
jgi:hypothetical protein